MTAETSQSQQNVLPTQSEPPAVEARPTAEDVATRVFGAALGAVDLLAIYLGDRLGLYRALAERGPQDVGSLADATGVNQRYVREWLEQQAVTGLLETDGDGEQRRFVLPDSVREVLLDSGSLNFLTPLPRMFVAAGLQMPALLDAYRTGGGVSWAAFGTDMRESQADMNRPWFEQKLARAFAGVPEIDDVLRRPGARIADLGCGGGWSSISLARAYPAATVDGYDVDLPSVDMAIGNAAATGLSDQVHFHHADVSDADVGEGYDAVFAFECVHDLARPVEFLAAARRATARHGVTMVMDEAVQPEFTAPGDEVERLMYGFSLLVCLPDGMSHPPSAGTGTVMREATLRRYAEQAGFDTVAVLPIEGFGFWRFYRLS